LADRKEYGCCSFGFDSGETGENSKKAAKGGIVLWNWGKLCPQGIVRLPKRGLWRRISARCAQPMVFSTNGDELLA